MPATITHRQYEQTTIDAERFSESLQDHIASKLAGLKPEERSIYRQAIYALGCQYGFENEADDFDAHQDHGSGCSCNRCVELYGLPF